MLTCSNYLVPSSLEEALEALVESDGQARLLAGATDTFPWARQGRAGDVVGDHHVKTIIDVSRVEELVGYTIESGRVRLGANVVFQEFLNDDVLMAHLPNMPFCAMWFADDQIRRQATLAGNIANASPVADGTPSMVALNAEVELSRLDNGSISRRTIPVFDFITGPGKTDRQSDEIITALICDSLEGYGGSFEKVGQRRSLVISVVCATCCVKPNEEGTHFEDVRLALGGVGPVPIRLADVEEFLRGKKISHEVIKEAASMTVGRVASRTRRNYREEVVRGFTERALFDALADCAIIPESVLEVATHG